MSKDLYKVKVNYGTAKLEPVVYKGSVATKRMMVEAGTPLGILLPFEIDNTIPLGEIHTKYSILKLHIGNKKSSEKKSLWQRIKDYFR